MGDDDDIEIPGILDMPRVQGDLASGSDIHKVVQAHLCCEYVLNNLIESAAKQASEISLDRFGFNQKVEICSSFELLPLSSVPALKFLNKLRNRVAHRYNEVLSVEDKKGLWDALPEPAQEVASQVIKEREAEGDLEAQFSIHLEIVVGLAEANRMDLTESMIRERRAIERLRNVLDKRR